MRLELRILGPLTVSRDARAVTLPASRKVRALLAFLALSPRPVSRRQLCALLWDSACDPRAELRWHLSKLRAVVGTERVKLAGDGIGLELADLSVDALAAQRILRTDIHAQPRDRLLTLHALFRGEFLEGLEVDHCPAFTGWVLAQRRHFRACRLAVLERLALEAPDEDATRYIEEWLGVAPFDIRAHERLFALFAKLGRFRDGDEHLKISSRLFRSEGLDDSPLRAVWRVSIRRDSTRGHPAGEEEQAHDCYLLGRLHLGRMMQHGLEESRRHFHRAIEIDAGYAPAWAGLATAHACLHEWFDAGGASLAQAEKASRRALEAGPRLAEAHTAHAFVRSQTGHYAEAVRGFEAAIRINPYLFDAYYYSARAAFAHGDMERAAEMFRLAGEARPEDFQSAILLAMPMSALRKTDAARDAVRGGILRAELALAVNPRDGRALSLGAGALIDDGQTERALDWSRRALDLYPHDTSALVNVACVFAKTDERSHALGLLERVFARGCGKRDWVANDPDYVNLHGEPRFRRLVAGLK